ncbi:Apoptosis inhibitor [Balamuthia mandrillaris]
MSSENVVIKALLKEAVGSDKFASLDETVVDYLIGALDQIQEAVEQGKERVDAAVQELAPLLVDHDLCEDDESAQRICSSLLRQLGIEDNPADEEGQTCGKTLLKAPVQLMTQEELAPKKESAPVQHHPDVPLFNSDIDRDALNPVDDFLKNTKSEDPKVRRLYLRELCPCHVKRDIAVVWDRILEMVTDPDPEVRYQVLHNLCDGSPANREEDVIRALEGLHNDQDKLIRRRSHQVLSHYRRTGKWNIL